MEFKLNRAWVEINLDNIIHNVRKIREVTNKNAKLMAVVKADAYGHGVKEVAQAILETKFIDRFAVSMLDEAIELRKLGIKVPILVLGYTDPRRSEEIVFFDITQSIFEQELAKSISNAAVRLNKIAKVHVKVDTGMSRIGFLPGYRAVKEIKQILTLKNIIIEGMFTHFSSADEESRDFTNQQYEYFVSLNNELNRIGIHIPTLHAANSAAIICYPNTHLNMVRAGLILYGMYPSDTVRKQSKIDIKPAMTFKANIIQIKAVPPGTGISYNRTYVTDKETIIATLSVGYADGLTRNLSNKGQVLVAGQKAEIIGRICMDQCMIDITNIKGEVNVGDEVVIYGSQGENSISIDDVAKKAGQINYELCCIVGRRIPRVYIKNSEIYKVVNYLNIEL